MRTIHEIEASGSEQAAEIVRDWYEARDRIARQTVDIDGPHAELLTPEQRMRAAAEQKAAQAAQKAQEYRSEYEEFTSQRNEDVLSRKQFLHKELYAATPENAAIFANAALATDEQLAEMVEMAHSTGLAEVGRAAFVAAQRRELGEVVAAYFDKLNPEARELYQEYSQAPSEESLENRLADAETIFAAPEPSEFTSPSYAGMA